MLLLITSVSLARIGIKLLHRNRGPTTPPIPSDSPRPVFASFPHIILSYLAQVSVQKVPPTNTSCEYCVPYPSLNDIRTRGIKSYQCRVCREIQPLRKCHHFLRLSLKKRLQEVHIQKWCLNWYSDHHCHKCGKGHHTLLHTVDRSSLLSYFWAYYPEVLQFKFKLVSSTKTLGVIVLVGLRALEWAWQTFWINQKVATRPIYFSWQSGRGMFA